MSEYIYEHSLCHDHFGKPLNAPMLTQREEIVRCRDCKYFAVKSSDHEFRSDWFCKLFRHGCAEPDGFCKWVEKKTEQDKQSELRPCPFCGGEARLYPSEAGFFVGCFNDGCVVNPCSGEFVYDGVWDEEQKEAAIDAWNTRAERTCRNVSKSEYSFRCSECDATDLDFQYPDFCHGCGAKVVSE